MVWGGLRWFGVVCGNSMVPQNTRCAIRILNCDRFRIQLGVDRHRNVVDRHRGRNTGIHHTCLVLYTPILFVPFICIQQSNKYVYDHLILSYANNKDTYERRCELGHNI